MRFLEEGFLGPVGWVEKVIVESKKYLRGASSFQELEVDCLEDKSARTVLDLQNWMKGW